MTAETVKLTPAEVLTRMVSAERDLAAEKVRCASILERAERAERQFGELSELNLQLLEQVAELRAEVSRLRAALRGVSPWNLQDCWCAEPDRREKAGPDQHRPECLAARSALKRES